MKDVLALILLLFSCSLGDSQGESENLASQEPVGGDQYVDEPIAGGAGGTGDDFYYEDGQDANKGKENGLEFHSVKPYASNNDEGNQDLADNYEYDDNAEISRSSKVMKLKTSRQDPKGDDMKRDGASRKRSPQKGDNGFGEDPNFDDALGNNDEIYDYIPDDAIEKHDKPASSVKQEGKVNMENDRKQFRSEILPSKQSQNDYPAGFKEEPGEASPINNFHEDNVDKSNLYGDLATREKRDGTDSGGASSNNTATNTKTEDVKKESTPPPVPAQSSAGAQEKSSKGPEKEIRYLGGGRRALRTRTKNGITHLGGRSGFGGLRGRSNDIIQLGDNSDIDFGGYSGKPFGSSRTGHRPGYLRNSGMSGRSFGQVRTGFLHNGARGFGSGLGGRSFKGGRGGFGGGGGTRSFHNGLGGRSGITRLNGRSKSLQLKGRRQQVGGEILDVKIKKRDVNDPAFKKCKEMCTSQPDYKGGKICGFLEIKEGVKEKLTGLQWAWYRNQCERRCDMAERVGKRQCKWLSGQQGGGGGGKPKPRPTPGPGINPGNNLGTSPPPPIENTSPIPGDPSPAPAPPSPPGPNQNPDPGQKPKDALSVDDDENDY